jgi:hypothetical protein
MMARDRFMFFENFKTTAALLDDKNKLAFYEAITDYVFSDIEPTDPYIAALLNSIKPSLDKVDGRCRNGGNHNPTGKNQHTAKLVNSGQSRSKLVKSVVNSGQFLSETETETEIEIKENTIKEKSGGGVIDWADVLDRWNRIANKYGLSQIKTLTEKRKKQFRARLEEQKLDTEQFFYFVNKALWTSPFLQGYEETIGDGGVLLKIENENKWKADFDFCLQSQSFSRMRENFYCRRYPERLVEWEELERQQGGTNAD